MMDLLIWESEADSRQVTLRPSHKSDVRKEFFFPTEHDLIANSPRASRDLYCRAIRRFDRDCDQFPSVLDVRRGFVSERLQVLAVRRSNLIG